MHRGPHGHNGIQPSIRQEVDGGEVLGQPQRILQQQTSSTSALKRAVISAANSRDGNKKRTSVVPGTSRRYQWNGTECMSMVEAAQ
ncbi:hypothetical protein AAFP30_23640 [Gordonia sp. CPCC 205515]|uniref:hypothetical protein n=1 Tax=Gordonia sp. CPCC 205515 TaxID=3140791 RepID=UPI003AF35EEC